jgi:sterol desaturase/sphingolipid hydroxylase (fatty acid hydroxylase superfamily)
MDGKVFNGVMDRGKIPHLIFYCIGFGIITYIYGIKAALVLVLFVMTIWAYSNLIAELFLKAKEIRAKKQTTNKKIVISGISTIFLTVLGAFLFTKLIWEYVAVLTAIVFIPVILYQVEKQKS